MCQMAEYIECYCEECDTTFKSFIAKDICPICEQLLSSKVKTTINYEKIKSKPRWKDEIND